MVLSRGARLGVLDGPRVRERYYDSIFFDDNLAAVVLGCVPGRVVQELARARSDHPHIKGDPGKLSARLGALAAE